MKKIILEFDDNIPNETIEEIKSCVENYILHDFDSYVEMKNGVFIEATRYCDNCNREVPISTFIKNHGLCFVCIDSIN